MIKEQLPTNLVDTAEFSVIDVETTGLSARTNRIIEIGIVKVKNLKVTNRYETLINPGTYIPDYITQLTGITEEDVFDAPFFEDIAEEVKQFIGDSVLSGHNLPFDHSFFSSELLRCGSEPLYNEQVCTLKLARRMFPELKSKSLSSVTKFLNLRNPSSHRALADAEVTARILIKMIKKLKKESNVKTIKDLISFQRKSTFGKQVRIKESLKEDVLLLPNSPGIYYFINKFGKIIYVGKAKSLRDRIRSYFSPTAPRKAKRIITQAKRLKIETTNSELTALLTEAETIKKLNPKHNYQLKRYGHKYFLRVTKTHRHPKLEISNDFDFDGNDYFGLFISKKKAEVVLEIIDKTFALRECTDKELAKQKKCFLAEIERCTAPCVFPKAIEYHEELIRVYEFLYGKNQTALNRMLNKMKDYSDREKYEKAAEVKAIIDLILSQTHKTSLLGEPVNSANVLFEITEGLNKDYVLLLNGKIFIKDSKIVKRDLFDEAIEDFYNGTINYDYLPTEEDLEKMKITLNWLIKNRNKVRIFYLKEFVDKKELFSRISSFTSIVQNYESFFDIKGLVLA